MFQTGTTLVPISWTVNQYHLFRMIINKDTRITNYDVPFEPHNGCIPCLIIVCVVRHHYIPCDPSTMWIRDYSRFLGIHNIQSFHKIMINIINNRCDGSRIVAVLNTLTCSTMLICLSEISGLVVCFSINPPKSK